MVHSHKKETKEKNKVKQRQQCLKKGFTAEVPANEALQHKMANNNTNEGKIKVLPCDSEREGHILLVFKTFALVLPFLVKAHFLNDEGMYLILMILISYMLVSIIADTIKSRWPW